MNRASKSLPTPLSPVISTLAWPTAMRAAALSSRSSGALQPMSVGSGAVDLRAFIGVHACGDEQVDVPPQRFWRRRLEREELDPGQAGPEAFRPPIGPADPYDFVVLRVFAVHRHPGHRACGDSDRDLDQATGGAEVDEFEAHFAHDAANSSAAGCGDRPRRDGVDVELDKVAQRR